VIDGVFVYWLAIKFPKHHRATRDGRHFSGSRDLIDLHQGDPGPSADS
jgi:hypothetical protein